MADSRDHGEQPGWVPGPPMDPLRQGRPRGSRNRGPAVLALLFVATVLVATVLVASGLLHSPDNPAASVTPSTAANIPEASASAPSSVPASPASPVPSPSGTRTPAPRSPTPPTSPGLIAVIGDDGSLATMDDGGGSRVTYPAPPVAFGFPAWSPDGSQIAVVGTGADDSAIYVFDVPKPGSGTVPAIGPEPVVIYRSAERLPFYLYWRPDGRHVGFLAGEPVGISLRVAPADGSGPLDGGGTAAAIRRGQPLYFDWVDARRLLVHVNLGSDAFTGEVGLDGAPLEPSLDGSGLFRSASLSRDGSWVAYVSSAGDGSQKLVVASRPGPGSHETEVFGPTAFVFDPAGDALAWIASDEPVGPEAGLPIGPLRLTDPTTGAVRTLLDRPVVGFFWSPDGRTIATILPSQPGDDVVNPGTGGVSGAAAIAVRRAVSPVGQAGGVLARLAFVDVSTGATRSERVVRLAEGFVNQLLPYFDQYALSHRVWAPDSAALLLPLVDAIAGYQLVAVSPDGAEPKPVADGMRGFWSP